jgi:DNA-directed RNA polymerase specialized sigma24 family protein
MERAMDDKEALRKRDAVFAERLSSRDPTVLVEIDATHSGYLRRLLMRYRGPCLNNEDIDDIVQVALLQTWKDYKQMDRSVRSFYFAAGKCRLIDHLRKIGGQQRLLRSASSQLLIDHSE